MGCIRVSFLPVFLRGLASVSQLQSLASSQPKYTPSLQKSLTPPTTTSSCSSLFYSLENPVLRNNVSRVLPGGTAVCSGCRAMACPSHSPSGTCMSGCDRTKPKTAEPPSRGLRRRCELPLMMVLALVVHGFGAMS